MSDVAGTIIGVANSLGVDPYLALAQGYQESGLNPTAVGDNGTSFGIYQLHQGGELGNLTPEQAFDPATNAQVSLSEVAAVAQAHPDWTPGQIAAAAQRPADPGTYAMNVNALYSQAVAGTGPFAGITVGSSTSSGQGTDVKLSPGGVAGAIGKGLIEGAVPGGPLIGGALSGAFGKGVQGIASGIANDAFKVGLTIVFVVAGLGLVILGLTRLFPTSNAASKIGQLAPLLAAA